MTELNMKYFSKIKKAFISALMVVSCLLLCVGFVACKNGSNKNDVPELFGFDVGETITAEQYSLVLPKNVHVTDAEGTMYDVVVEVRDSQGNKISTDEGNKFNANDAGGYTITYSIETWDFSVSKTVQVVVNSLADNLNFEIECDTLVSVGERVAVEVSGDLDNPQYTLSVVYKETGEPCLVNDLSFKPLAIGVYTVQMMVKDGGEQATKTMDVYARKPLQEGEVEVFDKDWLTVREFSPKSVGMEGTWTAATTEETGVKDAEGENGEFAVLETQAEYTHIYFNIRESRAYYRDLAMKGYTHVRFRVYVDSPTNRGKLFNWEHNSTNSWRTSLGNAVAGKWTEFYIPLTAGVAGYSDKKPGFVESYDYYSSTWILLLDNSTGSWNANGREVDEEGNPISFKVYFDDVFAIRRTHETAFNTTINADVYNLASSTVFNRAWGTETDDYTYSIIKHTQYGTQTQTLVNNQTLTNNAVDLSALAGNDSAYGSYEIVYFMKTSDPEKPYQRVWIDVMDESMKAYAHPDLHNFASTRGLIWRYEDGSADFKANTDGTMTYTTAGSWGAGLQIMPAYELSYYKALQSEGYKALTFDLKLDVEYKENASEESKALPYTVCPLASGTGTAYTNGETHEISVGLDKIILFYTKLKNVGLGADPDKDWFAEYVLFHVQYGNDNDEYDNNDTNDYSHSKLTFTISDFKMEK